MILEKLKEIFKNVVIENELDYSQVNENSRLYEDLCLNSISLLMLAIGIEQEFDIQLPTFSQINCVTIGDMVKLVEKELSKKKK